MKTDEQMHSLNNIKNLLEKQIQAAIKGNHNAIEQLAQQADTEIKKLSKSKPSKNPDFENQRKHVLNLYKKLDLMLAGEKAAVMNQQKLVDNVRKTLSVYRKNG